MARSRGAPSVQDSISAAAGGWTSAVALLWLQCCGAMGCGAMGCGASRVRVSHPDRSLTCSHGELETARNGGRKGNPVVRSSLNGIPGRIQRVVLRVRTLLSKMHDATR